MFFKNIGPNQIAYFSMEVGLDSTLPTYSGGLGILAGDTLRAAADSGLPMSGITLLHRKGYFRQRLDVELRGSVGIRAAAYKRADLLFTDLNRLVQIAEQVGPLQVIYSGKAHPQDEGGKAIIRRIFEYSKKLRNDFRVVYLENYDMDLARTLCAGVDLWLNTPERPLEASGTSGMKAALNGVPSLSVLDGWWIEGHVEGATGWAIGENANHEADPIDEANSLYDKLEHSILPLFYGKPDAYSEIRRSTIALNGSFFHTQRMVLQYVRNAYLGVEP